MDLDYHALRGFADSWGLVYMAVIFVVAVAWALRPGSRRAHDDAARIPFKED